MVYQLPGKLHIGKANLHFPSIRFTLVCINYLLFMQITVCQLLKHLAFQMQLKICLLQEAFLINLTNFLISNTIPDSSLKGTF